jgi:hypothetical protein
MKDIPADQIHQISRQLAKLLEIRKEDTVA